MRSLPSPPDRSSETYSISDNPFETRTAFSIALAIWLFLMQGVLAGASFAQSADQIGRWGPVLDWGVQAKHMILLPTGEVLVWSSGEDARVWDPSTDDSFTPTPFSAGDLHCASQATLADGRIMIGGGQGSETHQGIHVNALFDAFTKTWTEGAEMNDARWYATLLALDDGRVVITTGDDENKQRVLEPEIYDPVEDTWTTLTGASRADTLYTFMYQLPDGRIFSPGPRDRTWFLDVSGDGAWTEGPRNSIGASGYSVSSAMVRPGVIMNAGGGDPAFANVTMIDMNDPNPSWRDIAPMNFARRRHDLTILPDGTVLAVGGTRRADDDSEAVLEAELFDPESETWTVMDAMTEERMYHSSTVLLPDGRVVAAGGEGGERRRHAQVYSPPYLFKGARPVISSAPEAIGYDQSFFISTPDAASISSVVMLRGAGATHTYDQNQRYIPLAFTATPTGLQVESPPDAFAAAPGYHMLFIVNDEGVPAIAPFVRLAPIADLVPGSIRGLVTNSSGTPITGATIAYPGESTSSNGSGEYDFQNVPAGTQTLTVDADGFATSIRTLSVSAGEETVSDFSLTASGSLTGVVTAQETGLPIAAANIEYDGGSAVTNSLGQYSIPDIGEGLRFIRATAVAFEGFEQSIEITAGQTATLDFDLLPGHTVIEGEVLDAETLEPIPFSTVAYSGGTLVTDFAGFYLFDHVAEGTHIVTASADGYVPASAPTLVITGFESTLDFALERVAGPIETLLVDQDSKVKSSSPSNNYGTEDNLRTRFASGGITWTTYLQFEVNNLTVAPRSATLRLYATDATPDGGTLFAIDESFLETDITHSNAPDCGGTPIAEAGEISTGQWIEFDVTSALTSSGIVGFCLASNSSNSGFYSSKEGANPPELVIEHGGTIGTGETLLTGTLTDSITSAPVAGATVSYSGEGASDSTLTDESGSYLFDDIESGSYLITATASGYGISAQPASVPSGLTTTLNLSLQPLDVAETVHLVEHDAKVRSNRASRNYGDEDTLRVKLSSSGDYQSYLGFDVSVLSQPSSPATLRLFVTDASPDGGSLYPIFEAFDEDEITYDNAPECGGVPIAVGAAVDEGTWVEFDVESVLGTPGLAGFCLASESSNSAFYSSKEGDNPPELVVGAGSSGGCSVDSQCDDGIFCNGAEICQNGVCEAGLPAVCDDSIGCTNDSCDVLADACRFDPLDRLCNDGFFCDGVEVCNPAVGCEESPVAPCAGQNCEEAFDVCTDSGSGLPPLLAEIRSGGSTGSDGVETDSAVTGIEGNLYLATVSMKPYRDVDGIDGLGLDWTEVASQCAGRSQTGLSLWVAQGTPNATETVRATLSSSALSAALSVARYGDVAANAIGNIVTGNSNGTSGDCSGGTDESSWSLSLPIDSPGATAFVAVARRNRTHVAIGFDATSDETSGSGGDTTGLSLGDRAFPSAGAPTLGGNFSRSVDWAAIAIELLSAPAVDVDPALATLPHVHIPAENPITEEKRILGKMLFWDEQLGSDDSVACGTCHEPFSGGADPRLGLNPGPDRVFGNDDDVIGSPGVALADAQNQPIEHPEFGFDRQVTRRSAPTVIGAQFAHLLFVDGAAGGRFVDPLTGVTRIATAGALESQAVRPPLGVTEMAHQDRDWNAVVAKLEAATVLAQATDLPTDIANRLAGSPTYPDLFADAFGDPAITPTRIAFAIATYERTLIANQTPWDLFMAGDSDAMTPNQIQGWNTFKESLCATCHQPPLFTTGHFHNIGVRPPSEDPGKQAVTGLVEDRGKFKTPTLRNAGLKRTFMHNGGLTSMSQAVSFYLNDRADQFLENLDPLMPLVEIPVDEELSLVDFLENGLVDPRVANETFPFDRPTLSGGPGPPN